MHRLSTLLLSTLVAVPLAAAGFVPASFAANASAGRRVFQHQCSICHSDRPDVNKVGPSLYGVVGRHIGEEPHYNYSSADKHSNIVWTPSELSKYIANPHKVVPGTKMPYPGLHNAQKRQNLIAFLKTLQSSGSKTAQR